MTSALSSLRKDIRRATHADEKAVVEHLLAESQIAEAQHQQIRNQAVTLVERCRAMSHKAGTLDAFLQEFGLSNDEGIALMCLAEALLRVPDALRVLDPMRVKMPLDDRATDRPLCHRSDGPLLLFARLQPFDFSSGREFLVGGLLASGDAGWPSPPRTVRVAPVFAETRCALLQRARR